MPPRKKPTSKAKAAAKAKPTGKAKPQAKPRRRSNPPLPRCSATTAKGQPCKRTALEGTDPAVCVSHAGVGVGRKTDLNEEVTKRIVDLLRAGNYVETAVAAAGIGRATFYDWLERGDPAGDVKADEPFRDFRQRVDHARAEGEARNVTVIATAASKDWKAAAWMLERQFPDRWGRGTSKSGGGAAPLAADGQPHHEEPTETGGTVTRIDNLRRRAVAAG